MKDKVYLIQYTSDDKWEKEKGIMIIEAKERQKAMLTFKKNVSNRRITHIQIIKKGKSKIIFNQDVSIL